MSKNLKPKISIFVTLLISILILTIINLQTKPLIAQSSIGSRLETLKKVIEGVEFVPVIPDTLWQVYDSSKNLKGIIFRVWPQGYAGVIPITAGVDIQGKITGVRIGGKSEGFKETEGFGSKVREAAFLNQFKGKSGKKVLLKRDGGEIDVITGATISARAVCFGLKKGLDTYSSFLEGDKTLGDKEKIFPEAKRFIEIIKDTCWYAISYSETLGIIFAGHTLGYIDTIKYLVGMNKQGAIEKVIITYSIETEGIGEKIREPEFLDKFKTGMPDVISGATVSSEALIKSVQQNIERFKEYLK